MRAKIFVIFFTVFLSCNQDSQQTLDELGDGLKHGIKSARKSLENLGPDNSETTATAIDEIEKLSKFEYLIETLPADEPANSLESKLNSLGELRWDCFHVENIKETLHIFCKRRPKSYLRYLKSF